MFICTFVLSNLLLMIKYICTVKTVFVYISSAKKVYCQNSFKVKGWNYKGNCETEYCCTGASELITLARTLQTLKVKYFKCLHLSQDCDIIAEALLLSSSTPGLRDRKPKTVLKLKNGNVCHPLFFVFPFHVKFIFLKVLKIDKKLGIKVVLFFLFCDRCQSLSSQSPRQDHLFPPKSRCDQGRLG